MIAIVSDRDGAPDRAGIGDRITITVENLPALLAEAEGGCPGIVLFLGGFAIADTPPERCDPLDGQVGFYLVRRAGAVEAWHALLGRPDGFARTLGATVGPAANRSLPTRVLDFKLVIIQRAGFYLFVIGFGVILLLFAILARRSYLLRDAAAQPPPGAKPPFSLSRFQMAFWLLLVVGAYLFVWVITGELDTITDSVLALLGIGSGTALGAAMIDASKKGAGVEEGARLAGERESLTTAIADLQRQLAQPGADAHALGEELAARKGRLVQVQVRLAARGAPVQGASTGSFIRDVLGDASGISIQRFQLFVWTFVLGMIFVGSVYRSLEMPEFSATMLGLMGISSGTYLGFKFPEQHPVQEGAAAPEAKPPATTPPPL